jgi:hypothetical protein
MKSYPLTMTLDDVLLDTSDDGVLPEIDGIIHQENLPIPTGLDINPGQALLYIGGNVSEEEHTPCKYSIVDDPEDQSSNFKKEGELLVGAQLRYCQTAAAICWVLPENKAELEYALSLDYNKWVIREDASYQGTWETQYGDVKFLDSAIVITDGGGGGIQEGLMRLDGVIVDPAEIKLELSGEPDEDNTYVAGYEMNADQPWRVILVAKTQSSWERRELDCDFRKWIIKSI